MADASLHLNDQELKDFLRQHADELTLLDFYADWCPHCQAVRPTLEALARTYKPQHVNVVMIDTDTYGQLAADYGVEVLPTLLLVRDEKVMAKEVGSKDYAFLENWIKKYDDRLASAA